MKIQLRFTYFNLNLFLLILSISLISVNLYSGSIDELNIKQTSKSGEQIKFVKIINNYENGYYHKVAESYFKYLSGKNVKWKDIEDNNAIFLGKIRQDGGVYWLYKLGNGKFVISEVDDYWDKNLQFSHLNKNHFVFISEIDSLKNEYINRNIWLNKVDNFQFESMKTFIPLSEAWFERFDKVKIIEIQTFYNSGSGNIWFEVENEDGDKAKVKFDKYYSINEVFDFNYYLKDPLNQDWAENIVKCIRSKKIKIGMTKYQVMISWGKPDKINKTVSKTYIKEQWVYKRFYSNQYLYFENGLLITIQD